MSIAPATAYDAAERRDREDQEALGAMMAQMGVLNAALQVLHAQLNGLRMLTAALDANLANVDELGSLFEAPALTRIALDAGSAAAAHIDDLVAGAQQHNAAALGLHAHGVLGLSAILQMYEERRVLASPARW